MIGPATFVLLIAATASADPYPPCTQQRTDNCSTQQQAPATLYIPCPRGQYCPPHDIPRHKTQR
jgi:hypothetical protein